MKKFKRFFYLLITLSIIGGVVAFRYYDVIMGSGTFFDSRLKTIYVPTNTTFDELVEILVEDSIIQSESDFRQVADWKRFRTPKPGKYVFENGKSLNKIINKLRSGDQTPVKLTFNGARSPQDIAGTIASQIEADSVSILQAILSRENAQKYGFNKESFRAMFIPNTYELWWNTDADAFVDRMAQEFKKFWTEERVAKASAKGLSQSETVILASIVKAETAKRDEAPVVAGLYLNRLRIGMPLQADPTLIYAHQDYSIRRVLDKHKEINSPYNTYKNAGLPPGPINFPELNYVEAVLDPEEHKYLYMCAKPDFSGYHNFARTLRQHNINAKQYQAALGKMMREQRAQERNK